MPNLFARVLASLPDALTASLFVIAWVAPGFLGPTRVKDLMLTMLIEFVVMHSSVFCSQIAGSTGSRWRQALWITGLSAFYLVFVVAFSFAFDSFWPVWAFGWLFVSRFSHLWLGNSDGDAAARLLGWWVLSAMAYLGGVFLTALLPLPRLGLTPDAIAALQIPKGMSGLWIDKPWTVIAFGVFYFGVLAVCKFTLRMPPGGSIRTGREPPDQSLE